ncbi:MULTISPECIES: DUF6491 family protein [unclassified Brevundimonas]|uniref:DUF6491 family protein n=1 Tax=unclassified Brevundimonas TaxID=2622653 RepID=UPI000700EB62|nr:MULTISPECIES: DUF6491 family protein [unclassified Brevundimonas]KQY90889.1 hypothetical protein ASD25_20500 [Brevundimonas sp. Root1423]KRA28399.1 hypothetical protein ASD59_00765 [Brevundimonas sp. Root608]
MRAAFTASAVAVALAACAPVDPGVGRAGMADAGDPPRARQCFSVGQVNNYTKGRPDQVFLRVGRDAVYELNAAGGCQDLDFAQQVALIPDGGMAGSRLCTDDWARVVVAGSTSPSTVCRVRISRQLTAAEVAALPPRHRP